MLLFARSSKPGLGVREFERYEFAVMFGVTSIVDALGHESGALALNLPGAHQLETCISLPVH